MDIGREIANQINYQAGVFRIAEETHKGASDEYICDLCRQLAALTGVPWKVIYQASKDMFKREFA